MRQVKIVICLLFILSFFFETIEAQILINEVCVGNASVLQDEDGDFPDWIELYNAGAATVNLKNYGISDETWNLYKWQFPDLIILPSSYSTIMASGKDRIAFFDHIETVVYPDSFWRYIVPAVEPDSNWRIQPSFNDTAWLLGRGGIGYGDGDDNTVLTPPVTSVYMRQVFNIVDAGVISIAALHIDYDDAFVAYINGVEIGRANIGKYGTPTPFDSTAFTEHEAAMYAGGLPEIFVFDGSVLVTGNNVLSIQVHNTDIASSDLSAIPFLSLAITNTSYDYGPTPPWFPIGRPRTHTNFKLSQDEVLTLTDSNGFIIDQYTIDFMQVDHSSGRYPDGNTDWKLFDKPTPDSTNTLSIAYDGYVNDPTFSIDAGFYSGAQSVSISTSSPSTNIYYTTNGNTPTDTNILYIGAIAVDSTMIVKASVYSSLNYLPSNIITNTFLIDELITLPVVSISTDSLNLWDWNKGIYVKGPFADTNMPYFGANFWQRIEIPAHIEYFDKQKNQGFEQDIGLKIYGNYSRSNPQKSFKIIAREDYGVSRINYKLFSDKEIYNFKQFILRNAGNDWNNTHFRDAGIQKLAFKKTSVDMEAYQPAVVFLNGAYWGVYNMREKINEHYISNNHGVNPDSIDLLEYGGSVMAGTNDNFNQLLDFIFSNSMTDSANYDSVTKWIDIDNFIDYFSIEVHSNNGDWLGNNVRFWREQKPGAKWRYILWDLDFGFNMWNPFTSNGLQLMLDKAIYNEHAFMFDKLLQNIGFRNRFINRYADLVNTIFTPSYFSSLIYQVRDSIDTEMPRHFSKWGWPFNNPDWGNPGNGTYNDWRNNQIAEVITIAANRQPVARQNVQDVFLLKKQVPVTLNVNPSNAGEIKINTVTPDQYPWAGIYYDSVPITITAIPNPGFTFSFWQSNIKYPFPDFNTSLTFNPDTNDVFTAYFFGAADTPRLTISEINYHSFVGANAGDWIELHNYSTTDFDISGWVFKDGNDENSFVIPDGVILTPDEYLVLSGDTGKFYNQLPGVTNVIGPFDFGLSVYGENLRIYDKDYNLYLSAAYAGTPPWPDKPNGLGYTLELLNPNGNLDSASNWFVGCMEGSPGKEFTPCDTLTDIEENVFASLDNVIALYPNPVQDYFVLEINPERLQNATFTFLLTDVSGQEVFRMHDITQEEVIVRQEFPSGMYFYKVYSNNDGYINTGKLVFQK